MGICLRCLHFASMSSCHPLPTHTSSQNTSTGRRFPPAAAEMLALARDTLDVFFFLFLSFSNITFKLPFAKSPVRQACPPVLNAALPPPLPRRKAAPPACSPECVPGALRRHFLGTLCPQAAREPRLALEPARSWLGSPGRHSCSRRSPLAGPLFPAPGQARVHLHGPPAGRDHPHCARAAFLLDPRTCRRRGSPAHSAPRLRPEPLAPPQGSAHL